MMPVRKKNVAADCVQGAEEDGYGSGSYISAVMYIDGEKPIANPHDRNERHGVDTEMYVSGRLHDLPSMEKRRVL